MTSFPIVPVALFARVGLNRPPTIANTLFPIAIMPKPTTRDPLGKIPTEPVYHGEHAFFRWRSRQNRRPATNGLGKTFSKPFMMAISREKAGITPKPATHERLGEIRMGNGLSWRSRFFPMALMPKPATGFGKFPAKTVYHGDSP